MKSLSKTFILIVLAIIIAQTFVLVTKTYQDINSYKKDYVVSGTGKAAGVVSFCINSQPLLNISDCSPNATQGVYYTCWIFGSDPDNNSISFFNQFIEVNRAFNDSLNPPFEVSREGYVNFTPSNNDVGNYKLLFWVSDGIGCSNSENSENFSLNIINVNDPPYLVKPIPNQSITIGQTLNAFYLDDYFADPDQDDLSYSVILTNSVFTVTIEDTTNRVAIRSNTCTTLGYAMFVARDPYDEIATSNLVRLECRQQQEEPPAGGRGGSGGGGGGGGIFKPCKSEYECYDYHKCNSSNLKLQKCVDTKGCDEPVFLTVPCKYEESILCNESWKCSEWGPCLPNGTHVRGCVDVNNCNTTNEIPALIQECEYIGTCDDGIKNFHDDSWEEGIDCGGPCPACKSIQVPYPFEEEKSILIYIITGIILLLLASILLYHYFRKEINAALAKAGWILSRRKKKNLLLSIEDKKKLLAGILDLEQKLDEVEPFNSLNKYSELIRYYFVRVKPYQGNLAPEFDLEELKSIINKKKVKVVSILNNIFVSSFEKYLSVEQNKALITKRNIILLMEELRNLVLQTSKVEPGDLVKEVKEMDIPAKIGAIEKVIIMITNAYIALQYEELEIAKKKYLELLTVYEKLSVKEQETVFEDVSRLYHNISYVNSWLEKPKEM